MGGHPPFRARRALAVAALLAAGPLAAACRADSATPVATRRSVLADSADQVMFGLRHLLTENGVLRAELLGDSAFFFEEGTRVELRDVTLTFFTRSGVKNAVLTSREGTYDTRTGRMEARGNVIVVSEDGRRLTTPVLQYNQGENLISSDSAFVLTEPGRRLEGVGFTSDPGMNNVRVLSAARGSAGNVRLPGGPGVTGVGGAAPSPPATGRPADTSPTTGDTVSPSASPGSRPGTFRLPAQRP